MTTLRLTERDIDVAARTILGEAVGEGEEGMRAVAHVIMNRALDSDFPDALADVSQERLQFSTWNALRGLPGGNRIAMDRLFTPEQYQLAREIVERAAARLDEDPTGGALFFHVPAHGAQRRAVSSPVKSRLVTTRFS